MPAPTLSIVIPNRDGRDLLATCLPSLLADLQTLPEAEVIVVDDHSSDGSLAWLGRAFPSVRTAALDGRGGFAAACNAGARAARAPVVAFLNNDTEVVPGWGSAIITALADSPDAVIAGGLTLFQDSPGLVNSAGVRITRAGSAADIGFGLPIAEVDRRPREVAGVSGVSMGVRAAWFRSTGGFDERLHIYFEDVELCLRAWLEGHTVRFTPDAVVLHRGGASSGGRYRPLRNYYGSRNRLLVAAGCLDLLSAARAVPLLLAQDLATLLWLAISGSPRLALDSGRDRLRGVIDGLRQFPAARRARAQRPAPRRTFAELQAIGIIEPWSASMREFARMRRREVGGRGQVRA